MSNFHLQMSNFPGNFPTTFDLNILFTMATSLFFCQSIYNYCSSTFYLNPTNISSKLYFLLKATLNKCYYMEFDFLESLEGFCISAIYIV